MRRREFLGVLGGAAAWPVAAYAQRPQVPLVGFLSGAVPNSNWITPFLRGLSDNGYIDGKNITVDFRWAENRQSALPQLAADLISRGAAVIVTSGGAPTALAAKAATKTIPIIALTGDDPVRLGLVESFNRPTGNVTGVSFLSTGLEAKRLSLLRELLPQASLIGFLVNLNYPDAEISIRDVPTAARNLGLQVAIRPAGTENEIDTAFAALARQQVNAILVSTDPYLSTRLDQFVTLAARYAMPVMFWRGEYARAGGLISYGTNLPDAYHQLGVYAARILNGDKPADLPFIQSSKFELVVNLKTAKNLGINVPQTLLVTADEVIE
jgi:putative ABC transport system substrate-binding protein